jgi:hypothetical protein
MVLAPLSEPKLRLRSWAWLDIRLGLFLPNASAPPAFRLGFVDLHARPLDVGCTIRMHLDGGGPSFLPSAALICDVDAQGSTADWHNFRQERKLKGPGYAPLRAATLKNQIAELDAAGAAYLFIDMKAGVGPWAAKLEHA